MSSEQGIKFMHAIRAGIAEEMERDSSVCLFGIDVGVGGGAFGVTRGLQERFGSTRVVDTPISEMGFMGLAVGAAMTGCRPIVEIMYMDFIGMCFDALMNQAAKVRFMSGDKMTVPMVLRTQFGAGRSAGPQHSQSLEALFAHIPGLKVVMPSTAADAKGLLMAAVRDDDPVVFVEHRHLYGMSFEEQGLSKVVPIGRARIARSGGDVTVVAYSRAVHLALEAASLLESEDVEVEVLDLRSIVPMDEKALLVSIAKTGKVLVLHEAVEDFGVGAEVVARIADRGFEYLDAPVRRLGAAPVPLPFSPALERVCLPTVGKVVEVLRELVSY